MLASVHMRPVRRPLERPTKVADTVASTRSGGVLDERVVAGSRHRRRTLNAWQGVANIELADHGQRGVRPPLRACFVATSIPRMQRQCPLAASEGLHAG
jgi:hypothetical protein